MSLTDLTISNHRSVKEESSTPPPRLNHDVMGQGFRSTSPPMSLRENTSTPSTTHSQPYYLMVPPFFVPVSSIPPSPTCSNISPASLFKPSSSSSDHRPSFGYESLSSNPRMMMGDHPHSVRKLMQPERSESESSCTRKPNARDEKRRATHNEVERRRRDKINNWIMRLATIVPNCNGPSRTSGPINHHPMHLHMHPHPHPRHFRHHHHGCHSSRLSACSSPTSSSSPPAPSLSWNGSSRPLCGLNNKGFNGGGGGEREVEDDEGNLIKAGSVCSASNTGPQSQECEDDDHHHHLRQHHHHHQQQLDHFVPIPVSGGGGGGGSGLCSGQSKGGILAKTFDYINDLVADRDRLQEIVQQKDHLSTSLRSDLECSRREIHRLNGLLREKQQSSPHKKTRTDSEEEDALNLISLTGNPNVQERDEGLDMSFPKTMTSKATSPPDRWSSSHNRYITAGAGVSVGIKEEEPTKQKGVIVSMDQSHHHQVFHTPRTISANHHRLQHQQQQKEDHLLPHPLQPSFGSSQGPSSPTSSSSSPPHP